MSCFTRGWERNVRYSSKVRRHLSRHPGDEWAIENALRSHALKMPSSLSEGREIITSVDKEARKFPDSCYLVSACKNGRLVTVVGLASDSEMD